jgi:hypothetical protein
MPRGRPRETVRDGRQRGQVDCILYPAVVLRLYDILVSIRKCLWVMTVRKMEWATYAKASRQNDSRKCSSPHMIQT